MAGRTIYRYSRLYADGYQLECKAQSFGPLVWTFDEIPADAPMCDAVHGALPGNPMVSMGEINLLTWDGAAFLNTPVFDYTTNQRIITAAIGSRAAPVAGDPAWNYITRQYSHDYVDNGGLVTYHAGLGAWDATGLLTYNKPWGVLLHADSAVTAVNSSTGVDDYGAATAYGGYMVYHVVAGNGTATIKVQDAAVNADGSFADLSGATSGSINCAVQGAGCVAIGGTATVRRYLRWQIVFGTATSVQFILSFVRRIGPGQ